MRLYAGLVIDVSDNRLATLYGALPADRQAKISRFRSRKERQRALFAEVMLRQVIRHHTGLEEREIIFDANQYGKPFVINQQDFHFNLSHSGDWVVCAVDSAPIGIDIEWKEWLDISLAASFFSTTEFQELMNKPEQQRISYFYDLWTLKESYVKALGTGLSLPLNSFSIKVHANGGVGMVNYIEKGCWFFRQYFIGEHYILAVCATHNQFPETLDTLTIG